MPTTKVTSDELEALKSINPKSVKSSQRWKHFGKIAELEANLAMDEKLSEKRKKKLSKKNSQAANLAFS